MNGATPGACPLCAADDFEPFSQRARDGRLLPTTICRRCGFVWVNPPPDDQALRRYYAWTYRREAKGTSNRTPRQVYRAAEGAAARAAVIRSRLKPGAMVLDVGCGGGELVYLLRRLGVDARGIEPDETYSEFARRELDVPVDTAFLQANPSAVQFLEFRADPESPYHDKAFDKGKAVILYCASGGRSALSGKTLKEMGYDRVHNLGAFKDWAESGGAVER